MTHGRLMLPEEIESMGKVIKFLDSTFFFGGRKTVVIAVDEEPELILKEGESSNVCSETSTKHTEK